MFSPAFRKAGTATKGLSAAVLDLLLPPVCPACRAPVGEPHALCARCWSEIRFIEKPYCPVYGTPFAYRLGSSVLSAEALADPPPFDRSRAATAFGDITQDLVHQLKYHDRPEVASFMARAMARAGAELLEGETLLIPIPLHRWRLWRRRFNQAAVLARKIAEMTSTGFDARTLVRIRATRQQVGLSGSQRRLNVQSAFLVPEAMKIRVQGRHVVLVDDVYTSGATVKAATRALLRAGAARVDVLTFARVLR
ncbi:comF family protein [Faunimonas pinastri]|uniref:ComF family protein n=1 Tax=Faunimonas pinastri TaxID=1855383 RepID=A0A1H9NAV5_9HYPH|nr:ComF family protein [Faunimonas pinastri]SER33084.1 comF family protein [Faunimonas pinastri]